MMDNIAGYISPVSLDTAHPSIICRVWNPYFPGPFASWLLVWFCPSETLKGDQQAEEGDYFLSLLPVGFTTGTSSLLRFSRLWAPATPNPLQVIAHTQAIRALLTVRAPDWDFLQALSSYQLYLFASILPGLGVATVIWVTPAPSFALLASQNLCEEPTLCIISPLFEKTSMVSIFLSGL